MFDLNLSQLRLPIPENTDVVDFAVKINGAEISQEIQVLSIEVERSFNRIANSRIVLLDGSVAEQQFTVSDQDTFSPGNKIEILAGYLPNRDLIFKGIIIKHALRIGKNGSPQLNIECRDKAVKMTVGRKNKYFFNDSDSGIIEAIAGEHGLSADVDSTNVTHDEMVQYYSTDWDFILTRAEANGKLVHTNNGELQVKTPDFDQAPDFTVTYGTSLFEFEAEMDARDQYPAAKTTAWDFSSQEIIESETSSDSSGGAGLPGAVSGALSAAGLSGTAPNTDYTNVTGIANVLGQHSGRVSREELQNWSEAQILKSRLSKLRGRAKVQGIAQAEPGKVISLQGVGQRHSGPVLITAVKHEILDGGWYTHLQFGLSQEWTVDKFDDVQDKAAAKLLPGIGGLQIGVVTKLENDPDGEFRIQLRLPVIDPVSDGIWARMAFQDAGDNRCAFFLPELGDEVIVGFINDDPRDAIVLGMLNSSAKPGPFTASDDNHQKGWQTRSGMKMVFDDEKSSWTLETPSGKKITIDDDDDEAVIEDQHSNKITLDSNGITIEAARDLTLKAGNDIKVEGLNITQKATAAMKCQGNSQAEISAAGELVVKGGIVRIN